MEQLHLGDKLYRFRFDFKSCKVYKDEFTVDVVQSFGRCTASCEGLHTKWPYREKIYTDLPVKLVRVRGEGGMNAVDVIMDEDDVVKARRAAIQHVREEYEKQSQKASKILQQSEMLESPACF